MGEKKDIGTLFENKLNEGKKIPNKSLWEKINISLDEEKRRKKRILFWFIGGGTIALLGLVLLFGNNFYSPKQLDNKQNNINLNEQSTTSDNESNTSIFEIPVADSLNNQTNHEERLSKKDSSIKGLEQYENVNSSEKNPEIKTKKTSSNKKTVTESFTISEKYYYYNSQNGKQIVTESKNEIDSLVDQNYKFVDSTKSIIQNNTEE